MRTFHKNLITMSLVMVACMTLQCPAQNTYECCATSEQQWPGNAHSNRIVTVIKFRVHVQEEKNTFTLYFTDINGTQDDGISKSVLFAPDFIHAMEQTRVQFYRTMTGDVQKILVTDGKANANVISIADARGGGTLPAHFSNILELTSFLVLDLPSTPVGGDSINILLRKHTDANVKYVTGDLPSTYFSTSDWGGRVDYRAMECRRPAQGTGFLLLQGYMVVNHDKKDLLLACPQEWTAYYRVTMPQSNDSILVHREFKMNQESQTVKK